MADQYNLNRFIQAQDQEYALALSEIKNGRKRSHWMWYIFPQVQGLGHSETTRHYAISDLREAEAYLHHPLLGKRLLEISTELLKLEESNPRHIFNSPDDSKLKSSMTLFAAVPGSSPVFRQVLDKYFNGTRDAKTLQELEQPQAPR